MDESCGAREICLSVPFLLYNCSGLLLTIVTSKHVTKGNAQVIPSSYQLIEDEQLSSEKEGLPILTSESSAHHLGINTHTISTRASTDFYLHHLSTKHFSLPIPYRHYSSIKDLDASGTHTLENGLPTSSHHLLRKAQDGVDHMQNRSSREVKPYMFAPFDHISASEVVVKVCASMPHSRGGNILNTTWSIPFPLVPASGSTNVTVPEECGPGAFLISVTSCPVAGELSGRTRAVTFQPRYVICNACSKDLCYRQKGTNAFYHLGVGQHSHLHWSDTTRELYISIRFNERGWQWSGSFLPDCLGDVQVKMHNYVSGTSNMVRVEVQNADMSICDKRMRNSSTNSSQLIVLSDDKTGFTPYRIDNFTMEAKAAHIPTEM
ncbi:uncharacterized protein M6B38_278325 [Iris pallida]|uniref:Vacuolar protein sorting-associated protein 13 VPS13 adaptor binding domain-containing protein n=1 Tax=Iris pallida TaxID=29817 RepID=A0AAX6HZX4_IRIPA|nr:uncharacterized protein M6B38_278325 [Iris pallida]